MAELKTRWLGLTLRTPFVVGASPLGDDITKLQALVEAGAGAVVLHSLFEEQLALEQMAAHRHFDAHIDMDAEARSFLPGSDVFSLGVDRYLGHLRKVRQSVDVPVLASLNGVTPGGWVEYARLLDEAGADGIELNLYEVITDPALSGADVEARQLEVVRSVVQAVERPVSVKLSPFYASVPGFARQLVDAGAAGVVVFNRFWQPDVNADTLDVDRTLVTSTSAELPLRLHALALLHGRVDIGLSVTGGVHTGIDAAKAILCGAQSVQMVSALLEHGASRMKGVVDELDWWLNEKGYESVDQARGVLSLQNAPNPHALQRVNYMKMLQGWMPRR
jgi:dihydroorotate dehydrogenase (fumarate)